MRELLPGSKADIDLHEFYAADWVDGGGLRVNFVASIDGGAHTPGDNLSGGLQTPGDNAVFAALRDLADVVLAGSGTILAEGYGAARISARRLGVRRRFGLPDVLPMAVISRSLSLDPTSALFAEADPEARTIVLTCEAADPGRRRALEEVADVAICGAQSVTPALARKALEQRGLTRILSEGGPTSFAEFARDGVADELCLSLSPLLVGPGVGRITEGAAWAALAPLRLRGLLEDDGSLFARYAIGLKPQNA